MKWAVNILPMVQKQESELADAEQVYPVPYRISYNGTSPKVLIVCEHASKYIPPAFQQLGLTAAEAESHIAWDPGALAVAKELRNALEAVLVEGTLSRLVYDCNRPPEANSAIPERSEIFDIPGNKALGNRDRSERVSRVYQPFAWALANQISKHRVTLQQMVTIHSFTPVFHGKPRDVEIGILHGRDPSFALQMMSMVPEGNLYDVRLNEPYAARDGVAHTLDTHGAANDLPSVMIEIRSDLIRSEAQQKAMAKYLGNWIKETLKCTSDGEAPL